MSGKETAFPWGVMTVAPSLGLEVADLDKAAGIPHPGRGTAILVCHGMGQQVPFETLELVARALLEIDRDPESRDEPRLRLRRVRCAGDDRLDGKEFTRVEITLTGADSGGSSVEREVHLYEAYWAPLTQGKVQEWDVIKFLLSAGWSGRKFAKRGWWSRWMFGAGQRLAVSHSTRRLLQLALWVVCSLLAINFTISAIAATRLFTGGEASWPDGRVLRWLTLALIPAVVMAAVAGALIARAARKRVRFKPIDSIPPCDDPRRHLERPHRAVMLMVLATLVVIILSALGMVGAVVVSWMIPPGAWDLQWWETLGMFVLWGLVIALSAVVRYFLIEFVGDVAAYISHHTVSRFDELRNAIQEACQRVGRLAYLSLAGPKGEPESPGSGSPGEPRRAPAPDLSERSWQYGRVIVVGHSLGSVVAYDTLNALIREDAAMKNRFSAAQRTGLLLTFGSPLDKTAFLFRSQKGSDIGVREVAAAAVQPMIQSYAEKLRPRRWINIWSPNDWISGSLEFYDRPNDPKAAGAPRESDPRRVCNLVDPEACTPLGAHSEYWTNRLLAQVLHQAVCSDRNE